MQPKILLILIGAVITILGLFMPFMQVGNLGAASLADKDQVAAFVAAGSAALAALAAFLRKWPVVWIATGIAGGLIALESLYIYLAAQGMKESLVFEGGLAGALGSALAGAIQLSWALPLMLLGLLAMFAGAALKDTDGAGAKPVSLAFPLIGLALLAGIGGVGAALGQQERTRMVETARAEAAKRAAEEKARLEAEAAAEKARQEALAREEAARQEALNQLEFTDFTFDSEEYSSYLRGRLTNNSDRVIHDISLKFDLVDEYENLVGDTSEYVDELQPGQTYLVEAYVTEDNAKTARFPTIKGRAYEYDWETP